jgi:hypothetical protein
VLAAGHKSAGVRRRGGREGGGWGRGGGGSHASSLRTLLMLWGLRIAEVADPATRIIVKLLQVLYVIIEPHPLPAAARAPERTAGRPRRSRTWRSSPAAASAGTGSPR